VHEGKDLISLSILSIDFTPLLMKINLSRIFISIIFCISQYLTAFSQEIPKEFITPPREFSVMPFWFWNDTLKDTEIIRQIADFEAHGVYGFVIHPRIGLPENVKWLSPEMIHSMNVAISEAAKRKMYVVLYDEGMYPSGSSSGQVVARNPEHAARGLAKIDLKPGEDLKLPAGKNLITTVTRTDGNRVAIIDQPSGGVIRGLHYIGEGGTARLREESPRPAIFSILMPLQASWNLFMTSMQPNLVSISAQRFSEYSQMNHLPSDAAEREVCSPETQT